MHTRLPNSSASSKLDLVKCLSQPGFNMLHPDHIGKSIESGIFIFLNGLCFGTINHGTGDNIASVREVLLQLYFADEITDYFFYSVNSIEVSIAFFAFDPSIKVLQCIRREFDTILYPTSLGRNGD